MQLRYGSKSVYCDVYLENFFVLHNSIFSGLFFLRSIFLYIAWNCFVILKVVTLKTIKDLRTICECYLATVKKIWILEFKTEITKFYKNFYPECRQKLETFNGLSSSSMHFTYFSADLRGSLYFVLFISSEFYYAYDLSTYMFVLI
jgi:hypothetical protein